MTAKPTIRIKLNGKTYHHITTLKRRPGLESQLQKNSLATPNAESQAIYEERITLIYRLRMAKHSSRPNLIQTLNDNYAIYGTFRVYCDRNPLLVPSMVIPNL